MKVALERGIFTQAFLKAMFATGGEVLNNGGAGVASIRHADGSETQITIKAAPFELQY